MGTHTVFVFEGKQDTDFVSRLEDKLRTKYKDLLIQLESEETLSIKGTIEPTLFIHPNLVISQKEINTILELDCNTFWVIKEVESSVVVKDPRISFIFKEECPSPVVKGTNIVMDYLSWIKR